MKTIAELKKIFHPIFSKSPADRVILFGSYARGESNSYSDIDLVIIANTRRPFVERFKDYSDVLAVSPAAVEMLVYTPAEFKRMADAGNPLVTKVLNEGKTLYERSAY